MQCYGQTKLRKRCQKKIQNKNNKQLKVYCQLHTAQKLSKEKLSSIKIKNQKQTKIKKQEEKEEEKEEKKKEKENEKKQQQQQEIKEKKRKENKKKINKDQQNLLLLNQNIFQTKKIVNNLSSKSESYSFLCNLRVRLHQLMEEHVHRTFDFVLIWHLRNSDLNNRDVAKAVQILLDNQKEIGDIFTDVFKLKEIGDKVFELFKIHILDAVPVLNAAKEKNKKNFNIAMENWNQNAISISHYLTNILITINQKENKELWDQNNLEVHLKTHLNQTVEYSDAIIKNDFSTALQEKQIAVKHMLIFAEILHQGFQQFENSQTK